jgi:predicted dehydrogenase
MGEHHAQAVAACPNAELVAVCDPASAALDRGAALGARYVTSDLSHLFDLALDAVVIASPSWLHAAHIQAAAAAGVAIFVEKPVALTPEEAETALRAVIAHGVTFQIGFQRRWDPRYRRMRSAIDAGEIGDPILIRAHGRDPGPSERRTWGIDRNGGIFLNCAIHDYDTVHFMSGSEITSVSATGAALVNHELRSIGDADICLSTLWLGEGAMAVTEWNRFSRSGYDVGMEVIGTRGTIALTPSVALGSNVILRRPNGRLPRLFDVFGDAFTAAIEGFVEAVIKREPAEPGVEEAHLALRVALAARASSASDGVRLHIPSSPQLIAANEPVEKCSPHHGL